MDNSKKNKVFKSRKIVYNDNGNKRGVFMNVIDVGIVLIILAMGVLGLKRGFFKQLVMSLGMIVVLLLSLALKDPLASFLSTVFPFFPLASIKGVSSIFNILFYQVVAFIIIFGILTVVFHVVLFATNLLEKLLKMTVILAIPSKIFGFLLGLIEGYILVFALTFLLTQPALNIDVVKKSKLLPRIQNSTPLLSNMMDNTYSTFKDVYNLKNVYDKDKSKSYDEFSYEALKIMLDHDLVKPDYIKKLDEKGKLNIKDVEKLLEEYNK